jgi:hypothetical protein
MTAVLPPVIRDMKPLKRSNDLVGDPQALFQRIAEDGYVYLQGVLDPDAVARLRGKYLDFLKGLGVIDAGATEPIWNGADLSDYPLKAEPLHAAKVWRDFVREPAIDAFFTRLVGGKPFWIPIVEYRVTAPSAEAWPDPFVQRHQDGFYNQGITFVTCWVPLMEVRADHGGLAIAEGMNTAGLLHDVNNPPQFQIPDGAIPDGAWRRSDYQPGDIVIFNPDIPHSGLPNHSDRFRLSMDIRIAPPRTVELPVLGEIVEVLPDALVVRNHDGAEVRVRVDADTYCRWQIGKRLSHEEMLAKLAPGMEILASVRDGHAVMMRPPR